MRATVPAELTADAPSELKADAPSELKADAAPELAHQAATELPVRKSSRGLSPAELQGMPVRQSFRRNCVHLGA